MARGASWTTSSHSSSFWTPCTTLTATSWPALGALLTVRTAGLHLDTAHCTGSADCTRRSQVASQTGKVATHCEVMSAYVLAAVSKHCVTCAAQR